MVTQITLGNFFTQNGRTVLGGVSGSGLDTEGLINGLAEAKRIPAKQLEDKIAINDKRSAALSELRSLLGSFQDSANFLRNPVGFANAADNAFKYTSAAVSSNTSVSGSAYLSVLASPGAETQSYTINEISSIAKAKKQSSGSFAIVDPNASVVDPGPSADRFGSGTFTFNGQNITLAAGDSLNTVASKFNAVSDDTGVTASIIKISDGNYSLIFSAKETGLDSNFDLESPATITSDPSGALSGIVFSLVQDASNAIFKIDNLEITRQSNSISDAIEDVTFNLIAKTTTAVDPTELSVDITPDTSVAKNSIINFVNAYNDLRVFFSNQTKLDANGLYSEDAVLATNSVFRSILSKATENVSRQVAGLTGGIDSISDLGITLTDIPATATNPKVENILNVDESKLTSFLSSSFSSVKNVFGFNFSSDNSNLNAFKNSKNLDITDFTLTINPGTSTYQIDYLDGAGTPQTATLDAALFSDSSGYTLTGQSGTPFDGLVLLYTSTSVSTIDVSLSQGLADRIFNDLDSALDDDSGSLISDIEGVATQNQRYQDEIDKIDDQIEQYREQLIARYSALESALAKVNSVLQLLDALNKANQQGG
jgi:flagellar hook-associated protein 2